MSKQSVHPITEETTMLRRAVLTCAAVALLAAAPAAIAKTVPKPQIVDPKGDSVAGQAALDIVSVQYSTTGTGAGKAYVPKKLIVALTLAGAPDKSGAVSYNLRAETDSCGVFRIKYSPGNVIGGLIGDTYATFGSCAEGVFFPAKVKGSVVSFEFALKAIKIDRGTEFSAFTATVDASDPAAALVGTDIFGATAGLPDKASGDGTWVIP